MDGMKYWDDFERRSIETSQSILELKMPKLRRLSIHITNKCNFNCEYCNERHSERTMPIDVYSKMLKEYSEMGGGIVHLTGGEPSTIQNLADYVSASLYENIHFHMNTNLFKINLSEQLIAHIKRLKVSLDTPHPDYFNQVCRNQNAFECVTSNLDYIHSLIESGKIKTLVSLTYTVTRKNFRNIPEFLRMYYKRWPKFYGTFFSSYKGSNESFSFNENEINELFDVIRPELDKITNENNDPTTKALFHMSHEKSTFVQGTRFPLNKNIPCYLSLSELCIDEDGDVWNCSHLFRDGIPSTGLNIKKDKLETIFHQSKINMKTPISDKCLYGCNLKLSSFNSVVHETLKQAQSKDLC